MLRRIFELFSRSLDNGSEPETRPAGIFVTHVLNERIEAHFARLQRESAGHIDWRLGFSRWTLADLIEGRTDFAPSSLIATRIGQAADAGRLHDGYLDLLLVPMALSLPGRILWIMEYDVDYSGHWGRFFRQFDRNAADLLTTTVYTRQASRRWANWRKAGAPAGIAHRDQLRAFLPLMRVTRRLLEDYVQTLHSSEWQGHYEYLLPTIARHLGYRIEDIGGRGPYAPLTRWRRNYVNTQRRRTLSPGTFVWRPGIPAYFHEDPQAFSRSDMLYHPIKADVPLWNAPASS